MCYTARMTTPPRISLCVAMYNVADYLPRFVERLAKQLNLLEMEVLFVNDASTDKSAEVLERELEKYPELKSQTRILSHAENLGISQTRQDGLEAARGTYVTWADPDDWMEPGMYQVLADKADEAQADYVWSDYTKHFSDGSVAHVTERCMEEGEALFCKLWGPPQGGTMGVIWNGLFRRVFLERHKIRFPAGRVSYGEDVTFLSNLLLERPRSAYLPQALYHYVKRDQSASTQSSEEGLRDGVDRMRALEARITTERERAAVRFAKQSTKDHVLFERTQRAPYRVFRDFFPEVCDIDDWSCNRPRKVLFRLAMKGPMTYVLARFLYRALHAPYGLVNALRRKRPQEVRR